MRSEVLLAWRHLAFMVSALEGCAVASRNLKHHAIDKPLHCACEKNPSTASALRCGSLPRSRRSVNQTLGTPPSDAFSTIVFHDFEKPAPLTHDGGAEATVRVAAK